MGMKTGLSDTDSVLLLQYSPLRVGSIGGNLGRREFLLELLCKSMDRSMFSRCITFLAFEEMFGGIDPWSTKVWGEVVSVSHHVVISDIKVVFDISPFIIGE